MSDAIKHECGIAMVRLLKPLDYYREKYGDALWGLNKLYLLMEKQHNRGQEGAGMAAVKLNAAPGEEYIFRERAEGTGAIQDVFSAVHRAMADFRKAEPEAVRLTCLSPGSCIWGICVTAPPDVRGFLTCIRFYAAIIGEAVIFRWRVIST